MTRFFFAGLGLLLTAVGFIGYVTPGLPGTVFLVLALGCFKKGSPRFEHWLLNHRLFGRVLSDWDDNRWMPKRAKILSVSMIWLFTIASVWRIQDTHIGELSIGQLWIKASLVLLAVIGTWYILRLQTKPETK
ncbi:MAG: YbaN family protein [Armatimonadetes bacterium]|nr:YbaN family protein [Armatimonadota bacterium]